MRVRHDRCMMTQQLGFSILTAPLAAIDRRALSQAWYSALHLAQHAAGDTSVGKVRAMQPGGSTLHPHAAESRADRAFVRASTAAARTANDAKTVAVPGDRRAPRSPLARRIERRFLDPARRTERATLTIAGNGARVHVAMQSSARGLRLIAVCPRAQRAAVARALEEVRYALAARGLVLHAALQEDAAC